MPARELIHATAISVAGRAALIRGASGAGKSDLALRCLLTSPSLLLPEAARLVADDCCEISVAEGARLIVRAPSTLRGRLEVRGLGIMTVGAIDEADVVLVVDLVSGGRLERLPDPIPQASILGLERPVLRLAPFESSAPGKLLLALRTGWGR